MKRILPFFLTSCLALFAGVLTAQTQTVVEIITGSENHEELVGLLTDAGLVAPLSSAEGTFTVFAPTDAAFAMLSEDDLAYFEDDTDSLASVLTYHVIGDSLGIDTFDTGMMYGTLNAGDSIYISGYASDGDSDTLMINGMMVGVTEIAATNGVVYSIDVILMQPVATVVDIVVNTDTLSILEQAVIGAELDDDLMAAGPFTVFAPSNDAFAGISADSLMALVDDEDESGTLATILTYHVVSGRYTSADLMDGMMLTTLQGEQLEVTISGDSVMIDTVLVTMTDMIADNGVVHIINGILLPEALTSTQEPAFAREVSIFPNPATSQVYVDLPTSILNNATLTLRDFTGRTLLSRRATSDREPIEVGALPTGTYLLEIRADGGAIQRKVMVQR
ncbi:putative secreted protein (Por secretion system target) [Neolewinella xylanilytica]|uniref:Putative secreted protein (Por secretion system target) n=1 Tax=Neolewinella xylanilytica TaxID=1514080 RepID=A0A2S6I9H6_9BACT|nr:fasciclin domain-containing protein [Neolewinella xylanilytica]PPK88138.1 putative secreted protein (Por secretion system target) [Neolewinella xylanilytica]